jgi:signal transduction histidine kinase
MPSQVELTPNSEPSLLTLNTSAYQRRAVLGLGVLLTGLTLLALPFTQEKLAIINPFIPMYIMAIFVADLIIAALFWSQFWVDRRPAIAVLATTYLFSGLISIPYLLSFPGLFVDSGYFLGSNDQSTNFLWLAWHSAFPLGIITYRLVDRRHNAPLPATNPLGRLSLTLLLIVAGLIVLLCLLAFPFSAVLPPLVRGTDFSPMINTGVLPGVWLLNALSLGLLVWQTRGRTVVQLWLALALLAWVLDVSLAIAGGSRFSLGWYLARVNSLLTSGVVVGALLYEVNRLYRKTQTALTVQKELDQLKDEFVSIASHELRNPLTSVKGFAQLLERGLTRQLEGNLSLSPAELAGILERYLNSTHKVLHQADRMQDLIDRLLDFSRLQHGPLELNLRPGVNLGQLVQRITETHRLNNEQYQLVLRELPQSFFVTCDETRLEQVFDNLIGNAFKYSPPGTTVTVSVKSDPATQTVVVAIQDEGQGISPEYQSHLFEQFYRVRTESNRAVEGMGLGLYISAELVRQHGGRIWLESEPGRGSTF